MIRDLDMAAATEWIRSVVRPTGEIETAQVRPWATVLRIPTASGVVWFKWCRPMQAFEACLTASLSARWPDRVPIVLAHDVERAWLLMADAGRPLKEVGNDPGQWLRALPRYAELQRGEMEHVEEHLRNGVPDLRTASLPARYEELLESELPIGLPEQQQLRRRMSVFTELCVRLAGESPGESIQHDDLHQWNTYIDGKTVRFLDWGDASIGHPFASLVVTFRFLEEINGLTATDPWFDRLRDAYLEPWGPGLAQTFELAIQVGSVAHAIAVVRQRTELPPEERAEFDGDRAVFLRRALRAIDSRRTWSSASRS